MVFGVQWALLDESGKDQPQGEGFFFFFFLREWGSLGSDTAMDLRPDSYQDSILTLCPLRTSASFLLIAVAFPTRQEVWLLT